MQNFYFRPPTDPLTDPQGPNVTGAFGEALTAALDVMAFTHDLDIGGAAQGLNLATNAKPQENIVPVINFMHFHISSLFAN